MTDSADDAWTNFVASLEPAGLERERMRVHGNLDAERPGSRQDHEMRFAHDYIRFQVAVLQAEDDDARQARIAGTQNADADREIHARGYDRIEDTNEHDIESAIRSYSQRQAARAAERNAA